LASANIDAPKKNSNPTPCNNFFIENLLFSI
jgi:hypothetical protein